MQIVWDTIWVLDAMRPSCFEVFFALSCTVPAFMAFIIVAFGGWRPGSPLWELLLLCVGAQGVILMLSGVLAWSWTRRR
jgi:hypothetical protein